MRFVGGENSKEIQEKSLKNLERGQCFNRVYSGFP